MESNIKGLVAAGHEMASELKAECGAVDMRSVAKLISDLATQLEVQLVRANALAAENELARKAVQAFCDVVGDNTEVIAEEVGRDGVLVILEAMKATGNMPATDAFLAEVRAQGVEMYADNLDNGA
ncbi:eae-like domain protein, partial [Escherichia coli]